MLGKEVTAALNERIRQRVDRLKEKGTEPQLAIVRIGERYFAVAVGKDEMSLLAELKENEFVLRSQGSADAVPFKDILEKFKRGKS